MNPLNKTLSLGISFVFFLAGCPLRRGAMLSAMLGERPQREPHSPSTPCGCTNCQRLFPYSEIAEFWDEGEIPVCPYCGLDAVLISTPDMTVDAHCLFAARKTYH